MTRQECFLCAPNQDWVYLKDDKFFTMLGLGPLTEGYSLLATRSHTPSMLDLPHADAKLLCEFSELVRQHLRPHYGEVIITEHGRIPACVHRDKGPREAHCFHAHRLVFTADEDLSGYLNGCGLEVNEYSSFMDFRRRFDWQGEYLYYERADGTCLAAAAPYRLVRRFFRHKMAEHLGTPELADWTEFPRLKVVEAARSRLVSTGDR
jgi:hypothetical protein